MKKYFSYLSMALIAFVFASCGLKGNHTSSGRAYELLVVVDHGVWGCRSRNLLSVLCILHRKIMIQR